VTSPYVTFGLPRDVAAYAALGAALVWVIVTQSAWGRRLPLLRTRTLLALLCAIAALLSAGYVAHYLRGGPRIIDASSYWLEARALSGGELAFDVPTPSASFRGRFSLTPPGQSETLAVLFPPGYPALLALGFLLRAPLLVGPLLAALLVLSTYWLSRELLGREDVARAAALLSALCATLRYHTADTMSHGLSALLFSVGLACAARGGRFLLGCGLALGWMIATRPVSGAVALVACLAIALRHRTRALAIVPALLPGIALLLAHQHAATGHWLSSTQLRYYELADGPPGCFRWGFGAGIGCLFEHGEVVKKQLAEGYGLLAAAQNSLRRLALNALDVANFAPLALLVPYALIKFRKTAGVLALGLSTLALMLAYAGFYFDGSYPGGGARFFVDALPLEHALLGLALCELRWARFAPPAMLVGFALHTANGHVALAARQGGRPMFEAKALEAAGVRHGLVFVSTDHGFNLGHDPRQRDPWQAPLVARARGDAHDTLLWERYGRPPAYRYRFDFMQPEAAASLERFTPELSDVLRFESEADWPLLAVSGGYGHPDFHPAPCVSAGRGLRLTASGSGPVSATFELVGRSPGSHELVIQWLADRNSPPVIEVAGAGDQKGSPVELEPAIGSPCRVQATKPIEVPERALVRVSWSAGSVLLDYMELRPLFSKMR
jgi:hypothetical protein